MATKRKTVKGIEAEIRRSMERIGKERDKLRYLVDEAAEICANCDTAMSDLESAADTLSQYL